MANKDTYRECPGCRTRKAVRSSMVVDDETTIDARVCLACRSWSVDGVLVRSGHGESKVTPRSSPEAAAAIAAALRREASVDDVVAKNRASLAATKRRLADTMDPR